MTEKTYRYKSIKSLVKDRNIKKYRKDYFDFLIDGKFIEFIISSYDNSGIYMEFRSNCDKYIYQETSTFDRYDKDIKNPKIKYANISIVRNGDTITEL